MILTHEICSDDIADFWCMVFEKRKKKADVGCLHCSAGCGTPSVAFIKV